jgi:NAD(P)-dependent dehydrogenase (short-subunit alcohol dehydrogenase family)
MMKDLQGKVALVTGGGSGIGRATAMVLAGYGASVVLADLRKADEVASAIGESGGTAMGIACDVSDPLAVGRLIQAAVDRFGVLDCAVNNAGIIGPIKPISGYTVEDWNRVIATNLTSVFLCLQQELAAMRPRRRGAIVNTSSIFGVVSSPNYSAYTASKFGVAGLTKTAALEAAREGIRVNAVCPGSVETPMNTEDGLKVKRGTSGFEALEKGHPIGRMAQPEEIAEAIAWLCSDRSSFVTGHCLMADGGYTAT